MPPVNKVIFGKKILFNFGNSAFADNLANEISIYPDADDQHSDMIIEIDTVEIADRFISFNPSSHFETETGFGMMFGKVAIRWDLSQNTLRVYISSEESKMNIRSYYSKFMSLGYTSPHENAGQLLHELVLVPMACFREGIAPVHCSSYVRDGKAFLFGGTGGTGKTSLLLDLCSDPDTAFLSDDIAIVGEDGSVHPNLAYPKIYAYNTIGNKTLETKLLENSSLAGRIQWNLFKWLDPARVRRRMPPEKLYKLPEGARYPIYSYCILFRGEFPDLDIIDIDPDKMTDLTLSVIKAEYQFINTHIYWHEFNRRSLGLEPMFVLDDIWDRCRTVYRKAFSNSRLSIIRIPRLMDHQTCIKRIRGLFMPSSSRSGKVL